MKSFKYTVDSFADINILRFKVDDFESLTLNQKKYLYYLSESAKCGRDILWMQKNRDNLLIRKTLENIIMTFQGDKSTDNYLKFIIYVKRIFFSNGMYHHYNKTKIIPEIPKKYFEELLSNSNQKKYPYLKNESFKCFCDKVINIIYSNEESDGDLITKSETNFYENITEIEAKKFYDNLKIKENKEPLSYGLNSKLIKNNNRIYEEIYRLGGLYGEAINKIIYWLNKALEVCENDYQKEYTRLLIAYYKTGDLKLWDEYNIAWVKENNGLIDYINGFIEVYEDPIALKGSWEAVVSIKDLVETKITNIIAQNAEWFEANSPVDRRFKKKEVKGIIANAINVVTLGGDCFPYSPIGINLPNADWIRERYGSKSVSISNLTNAYDYAALESPNSIRGEFTYDKNDLDKKRELNIIGSNLHTHLHECLGHGSGMILPGKSVSMIGEYYSTLEEARADLFALYYLADKKLIELGIIESFEVTKTFYESYIRGGLQVQLVRIELGNDIVEAHMQARKLISEMAYEKGLKDNIIEKKIKNNKTYFVVNDYLKLRVIFGELLAEIQRIKSEGDYNQAKYLINKYGVKIDKKLHEEVLLRYKKLNLKPYSGFMNPELKLVRKNNQIIDIKITYPTDFIKQQLKYGQKYSFLK